MGPLHGLPIAFKDLQAAVGFPCTQGSPIYQRSSCRRGHACSSSDCGSAGAIADRQDERSRVRHGLAHLQQGVRDHAQSLRPDEERRRLERRRGAALATGMLPIADGSDLGGSLRNPANFNNVVALRPTVGLVPTAPSLVSVPRLRRERTDGALGGRRGVSAERDGRRRSARSRLLSLGSVVVRRSRSTARFDGHAGRLVPGPRRAAAGLRACARSSKRSARRSRSSAAVVEEACPDLTGADEIFLTIRALADGGRARTAPRRAPRSSMKPEAVCGNRSGARRLTGADVARAMIRHGELMERVRRFQEKYEFMLCAVNQVPPFDCDAATGRRTIDGVTMDHYVAWMKSAYWITTTFCPAISRSRGLHRRRVCRSASRSSAATGRISASCRSRMRSSRPQESAAGGRRRRNECRRASSRETNGRWCSRWEVPDIPTEVPDP